MNEYYRLTINVTINGVEAVRKPMKEILIDKEHEGIGIIRLNHVKTGAQTIKWPQAHLGTYGVLVVSVLHFGYKEKSFQYTFYLRSCLQKSFQSSLFQLPLLRGHNWVHLALSP